MLEFYVIFARKVNKIPEFYMIIARKIFSDFFFGGNRHVLPPPVSYVHVYITMMIPVGCGCDSDDVTARDVMLLRRPSL